MEVLTTFGYDVDAAADGAAGWEAIQANHYDLIVTDNHMPKMSGIEMIEKLRSAHRTTRVIMATGHLPVFEIARQPWLTPDATLQQPFSVEELLATVRKVLGSDDGNDGYRETLLPKYL